VARPRRTGLPVIEPVACASASSESVTAGRAPRASRLRGGGNLGVVTSLWYQLHPVQRGLAGALATAPDVLASLISLGLDPDGRPAVTILLCWSGDPAVGERVLRPLRRLGAPEDSLGLVNYLDWQRAPDAAFPHGRQHYWKSGYLRHLTDTAVDTLLEVTPTIPTPKTAIGLQGLRGAAARLPADATAFPHRALQDDLLILAQWTDPARSDEIVAW
jgi:hypothetical protein